MNREKPQSETGHVYYHSACMSVTDVMDMLSTDLEDAGYMDGTYSPYDEDHFKITITVEKL